MARRQEKKKKFQKNIFEITISNKTVAIDDRNIYYSINYTDYKNKKKYLHNLN